ncbi:Zn-ribbon domain-containing OB-fold protein [Zhongshania sp.]|uniref:Zn-ribbon domain-containing OB-fold protein n=1 Tax=Zhongshania sp. TaxID=1971902 RepID=UPI003566E1E3
MGDTSALDAQQSKLNAVLKLGGDPADLPFWDGCEVGQFMLHRCNVCQRAYWPASRCIEHGDESMVWVAASGRGTLHTYTIMHRAYIPSMKDKVPFVVGVVELEEGPFYHSNIIDCDHDSLRVGMKLMAKMALHESGLTVPMFVAV